MRSPTLCAVLILAGASQALFPQGSTVQNVASLKGVVLENGLGGAPIANVEVSASGANPTVTKSNGIFTLEFPDRHPGDRIELLVRKEGYVVVNYFELEEVLPLDPDARQITILLCREGDQEEMARRYYRFKVREATEESDKKRVKELEERPHATEEILRERARSVAAKTAGEQQNDTRLQQPKPEVEHRPVRRPSGVPTGTSNGSAAGAMPDDVEAHIALGLDLNQRNDYDAAIREFRQALSLEPDNTVAREGLSISFDLRGLHLFIKGDYDAAIADFRQVLSLVPNSADAHHWLGDAFEQKRDYGAAISELQQALILAPNDADAHLSLGTAFEGKGDHDAAISELRKALTLAPNNVEAHDELGVALYNKGDTDASIAEHRKALDLDPKDGLAHDYIGLALEYRKHDLDAAIGEYRKALDLDSSFAGDLVSALLRDAGVLAAEGDRDAGIVRCREALALNTNDAEPHVCLGAMLEEKREYDAAIGEYQQALALKPNNAEAHLGLGDALENKGDHDGAIEQYNRALTLKPNDAEAHLDLGDALEGKGEHDGAIAEYRQARQALAFDPNDPWVDLELTSTADKRYDLGVALDNKGDHDTAAAEYREAVALEPDNQLMRSNIADRYRARGDALERKHHHDAAIAEYREALALEPDSSLLHYHLAVALGHAGRRQESASEFQESDRLETARDSRPR